MLPDGEYDGALVLNQQELGPEETKRLRWLGISDLYFFSRGVMGFKDMVPRVHKPMCDFIQREDIRRKLLLAPRSHLKTTCGVSNVLRKVCKNPEDCTLMGFETQRNANTKLSIIKQQILNNALFRHLYAYIIPPNINDTTWSQEEILLPRKRLDAGEPTIRTIGVGGAVVSQHFNTLDFDDLISEEALHSPTIMLRAVDWMNHSVSLLIKPEEDEINMRGTRWAYNDLYAHAMTNLGFTVYRVKAIVFNPETGKIEPLWKERFSLEYFSGIMEADPAQWAAQYANDPSDVAFADFQKQWLRFYRIGPDGAIRWNDVDGQLQLQDVNKLRVYVHVDPSMGDTAHADSVAVMTVGINDDGRVFILDAWQRRVDPLVLIEKLFELQDRFTPKLFSIESTAFQKSLRYYLDKDARQRGTYLHIEDSKPSTRKNKEARIRGALQPFFSSGMIFVREGQLDFVEQYLAFGRTDDDHMMDALAQGPEFWKTPRTDGHTRRTGNLRDYILTKRSYGISGYGGGLPRITR